MKRYDLFAGILLLVLSAVVFADSLRLDTWPAGAGTMPVIVSVLLAACSAALIAGALGKKGGAEKQPAWPKKKGIADLCYVGVVIVLFLSAMGTVGFLISTFLFTAVLLHRLSPYGWPKTIIVGLAVSIICFWSFEKLGLTLPRWLLERYLV